MAGRLDAELLQVTRRVSAVLQTLPKDITPVNLEELRRVKQVLVELESKADTLRCVLRSLAGIFLKSEDEMPICALPAATQVHSCAHAAH